MARKKIQDMIEELRSWLPNYDHNTEYVQLIWRILATLPGGDRAEDMDFKPIDGMGWHEADLLGRMLEAIDGKDDVEDLVDGLMADEDEVEESRRGRRSSKRSAHEAPMVHARSTYSRPTTTREHRYPPSTTVRSPRPLPRRR